jgi:thiol-disulfide isomerase/thioredoxin
MKPTILILLFLTISIVSGAQKTFISGNIKGFKNDTLTIFCLPMKMGETPIIDKIVCVDGKVNYEVQLVAPILHLVRITSQKWNALNVDTHPYQVEHSDINFFLNPGDRVSFTAEPGSNGIFCKAYGNPINEQRNEFTKKLFPIYTDFNSHCLIYAKVKAGKDSLQVKKEVEQIEKIKDQIEKATISFIQKHPDWEISAEVLMGLPMDSCRKYFEQLGPKAKSSFFGIYAQNVLFAVKIGDDAPQFSLPDEKRKTVSLSDFKGKYVVLEFWGTWCGYCVKDIPTMKEYYKKYNNKVEFVSIACRDSESRWKAAIEKYRMNWVNLLNEDEKLPTTYGIEGYPTKIIINPEGVIVGKYLGEATDFYKKVDELFGN